MINILRAGSYITIVDLGRYGYRRFGVPVSGAMDLQSATVANTLVSNDPNDALLELYMPGHRIQFSISLTIALSGADADIELDQSTIRSNKAYRVNPGSFLSIGKFRSGSYIYLAVKGGIKSQQILNSRSPLTSVRSQQLRTGDSLNICEIRKDIKTNVHLSPLTINSKKPIKARPGPEWHLLTEADQSIITNSYYQISTQSNRMGYRLEGQKTTKKYSGILSSGVMPGTVQLLPSGLPLILMRECQTTGGYMRILQLDPASINQLAQRAPGKELIFKL